MPAPGYTFSARTSLMLGYRRIDIELDNDRIDPDLSFQGPGQKGFAGPVDGKPG